MLNINIFPQCVITGVAAGNAGGRMIAPPPGSSGAGHHGSVVGPPQGSGTNSHQGGWSATGGTLSYTATQNMGPGENRFISVSL